MKYLLGEETIDLPASHQSVEQLSKSREHARITREGIDVRFPLNVMTVVTGVSGSGKEYAGTRHFLQSSEREYSESSERPGEFIHWKETSVK